VDAEIAADRAREQRLGLAFGATPGALRQGGDADEETATAATSRSEVP
jgi:hypothetical protein